jgi:hypothetical protein
VDLARGVFIGQPRPTCPGSKARLPRPKPSMTILVGVIRAVLDASGVDLLRAAVDPKPLSSHFAGVYSPPINELWSIQWTILPTTQPP